MKPFVLLLLLFSSGLIYRVDAQDFAAMQMQREKVYDAAISISYLSGLPQGDFRSNMQWNYFPGANFEMEFKPVKNFNNWKTGVQLDFLYAGNQKDDYYGLCLKSNSGFIGINFLNKLIPNREMVFKPYFEFAYGMNINYTSSTYEIVDKATFFDKFFFDDEDYVESYTVKKHTAINQNFVFGTGAVINKIIYIGVRYNYVPSVKYVSTTGILVQNGTVNYTYDSTPVKMVTISLGIILSANNYYQTSTKQY